MRATRRNFQIGKFVEIGVCLKSTLLNEHLAVEMTAAKLQPVWLVQITPQEDFITAKTAFC